MWTTPYINLGPHQLKSKARHRSGVPNHVIVPEDGIEYSVACPILRWNVANAWRLSFCGYSSIRMQHRVALARRHGMASSVQGCVVVRRWGRAGVAGARHGRFTENLGGRGWTVFIFGSGCHVRSSRQPKPPSAPPGAKTKHCIRVLRTCTPYLYSVFLYSCIPVLLYYCIEIVLKCVWNNTGSPTSFDFTFRGFSSNHPSDSSLVCCLLSLLLMSSFV